MRLKEQATKRKGRGFRGGELFFISISFSSEPVTRAQEEAYESLKTDDNASASGPQRCKFFEFSYFPNS